MQLGLFRLNIEKKTKKYGYNINIIIKKSLWSQGDRKKATELYFHHSPFKSKISVMTCCSVYQFVH